MIHREEISMTSLIKRIKTISLVALLLIIIFIIFVVYKPMIDKGLYEKLFKCLERISTKTGSDLLNNFK